MLGGVQDNYDQILASYRTYDLSDIVLLLPLSYLEFWQYMFIYEVIIDKKTCVLQVSLSVMSLGDHVWTVQQIIS